MTCSERGADRFACRLRKQKSARRRRIITKARAPRAIPILAPTLRPALEEELDFGVDESVASGTTVVVECSKDVVIREVLIEPLLELAVPDDALVGVDVIVDNGDEKVAVGSKDIEAPVVGVWTKMVVEI